jgi:starch phosphorylase
MELIYLVNHYYIERLRRAYPNDGNRISRMSIIEEGDDKKVRMATLAIVCAHTVNGVAAIHSDLLKKTLFKDFEEYEPGKI